MNKFNLKFTYSFLCINNNIGNKENFINTNII